MGLQCTNGVSSNPVEGRTKICQLKDLILLISCYVCHCVYLFWRYNLHAHTPGNAMSSSVCIKSGKGGVVYICVRGFNVVSICSTRFWTVLTMVFCVFHFINVLHIFNLSARCALLKQNKNLRCIFKVW
jgi:Na+(H+)/acetate symporter ActP